MAKTLADKERRFVQMAKKKQAEHSAKVRAMHAVHCRGARHRVDDFYALMTSANMSRNASGTIQRGARPVCQCSRRPATGIRVSAAFELCSRRLVLHCTDEFEAS